DRQREALEAQRVEIDQWMRLPPFMPDRDDADRDSSDEQHRDPGYGRRIKAQELDGEHDGEAGDAGVDEPAPVERLLLDLTLRHQPEREGQRHGAKRQVEEENPVPGEIGGDEAA